MNTLQVILRLFLTVRNRAAYVPQLMTIIATHSRQSVFILDEVTWSLGLFKQKPPRDFKLWVNHTIIPTYWQSSLTAFSKNSSWCALGLTLKEKCCPLTIPITQWRLLNWPLKYAIYNLPSLLTVTERFEPITWAVNAMWPEPHENVRTMQIGLRQWDFVSCFWTGRTSTTISLNICNIQMSLKTILEIPFEDARTSHTSALNNES